MKDLFKRELNKIRELYGYNKPSAWLYTRFGMHLLNLSISWVLTRIRFRKARHLGKLVFTKKKPNVFIEGELSIGNMVRIHSNFVQSSIYVYKGAKLSIGEGTYINGSSISAVREVIIHKNCILSPHVVIMDEDFHDVEDHSRRGKVGPIVLEEDVWLATRCTILRGVRIGKGSVVASGAVVTKDVPPNCLVGGVPAKVLRRFD